jgi:hypothetical protein
MVPSPWQATARDVWSATAPTSPAAAVPANRDRLLIGVDIRLLLQTLVECSPRTMIRHSRRELQAAHRQLSGNSAQPYGVRGTDEQFEKFVMRSCRQQVAHPSTRPIARCRRSMLTASMPRRAERQPCRKHLLIVVTFGDSTAVAAAGDLGVVDGERQAGERHVVHRQAVRRRRWSWSWSCSRSVGIQTHLGSKCNTVIPSRRVERRPSGTGGVDMARARRLDQWEVRGDVTQATSRAQRRSHLARA